MLNNILAYFIAHLDFVVAILVATLLEIRLKKRVAKTSMGKTAQKVLVNSLFFVNATVIIVAWLLIKKWVQL